MAGGHKERARINRSRALVDASLEDPLDALGQLADLEGVGVRPELRGSELREVRRGQSEELRGELRRNGLVGCNGLKGPARVCRGATEGPSAGESRDLGPGWLHVHVLYIDSCKYVCYSI